MEYAEEDKPSSFYLFEFRFVYENMFTLFNAVGLQQTLAKRGGGRRGAGGIRLIDDHWSVFRQKHAYIYF